MAERTASPFSGARTAMREGGVLHKAPPVLEFASRIETPVELPPAARVASLRVVESARGAATSGVCPRVARTRTPFPVIERIVRHTTVDAREARSSSAGRSRYVLAALSVVSMMAAIGVLVGVAMRTLALPAMPAMPAAPLAAAAVQVADVTPVAEVAPPTAQPAPSFGTATVKERIPSAVRSPAVAPNLPPPPRPEELGVPRYFNPPVVARPASHTAQRVPVKKPPPKTPRR